MDVTGHTRETSPATRQASIRDVAAAAGVSYQTVSRVINGHPSVRETTREHVRRVIDQLGFRPNRAARALAGGPVQSVTVLTPNTTLYGYTAALRGIEEAARSAGLAVGVRVVESANPAEVTDAVTRAVEPGGALIVIAYDVPGTMALAAVPPTVPMAALVETPAEDEGEGQPWIWVDDRKAALDATRYLLGLGHQTVHYLGIPSSTHTSQRKAGWLAALTDAGTRVPEPVQCGWTPQSGYEAARALASDPAVTALLCGNDDLAVGAMRALREAGRDVPGQVSVVGFDDVPAAAFLTPALTTVRLDYAEAGRSCFALLQALLTPHPPISPGPRPQPELIIRESAAPPPIPSGGTVPPRPTGTVRAAAPPARSPLDARQEK
ncbi:MAG TPA: LacI family DNA-binding transcriptional regulator [Streptosporangiaceae bacterium]|nr:LacI family DNA-binding transcriptional regulator [Streptosporangiaceae bacterium]